LIKISLNKKNIKLNLKYIIINMPDKPTEQQKQDIIKEFDLKNYKTIEDFPNYVITIRSI